MKRILFTAFLFFVGGDAWAQTVYLTPQEALELSFKGSQILREERGLSQEQREGVEKKLGSRLGQGPWTFYIGKTGKRVDGYALIDSETGKTEPMTFLTVLTPQGEVREVEILVYRESIGSEVHDQRFLKQFQKKTISDPLRVGQDIANISGATISAQAVSKGVRRALTLWNLFYGSR